MPCNSVESKGSFRWRSPLMTRWPVEPYCCVQQYFRTTDRPQGNNVFRRVPVTFRISDSKSSTSQADAGSRKVRVWLDKEDRIFHRLLDRNAPYRSPKKRNMKYVLHDCQTRGAPRLRCVPHEIYMFDDSKIWCGTRAGDMRLATWHNWLNFRFQVKFRFV